MAYTRIAGRRGNDIQLDVTFYNGGISYDPFYIYKVEIYKSKVADENLIDTLVIDEDSYPSPALDEDGSSGGHYSLIWSVPDTLQVPNVYYDVWYYWGDDPRGSTGDDLSNYEDQLLTSCNRFWLYQDQWYVDDNLQTVRLSFEPLDIKFRKGEVRPLEVGIMPLPLYDYNFNLVTPIIPYLQPTIDINTHNCEPIIEDASCLMKLRQGSYRSNPFVISYLLDTSNFYIGSYIYRIKVPLPNGSIIMSKDFSFSIS